MSSKETVSLEELGSAIARTLSKTGSNARKYIVKECDSASLIASKLISIRTYNASGLRNRTGALMRENYPIKAEEKGQEKLVVGVRNMRGKYAAVHEFGFRGQVNVRAHTRRVKATVGDETVYKIVPVKAHTRQMNIPKRSFMTPAVKEAGIRLLARLVAKNEGITLP